MELYTALKGRRSCRKYQQKTVPREVVERILTAANWAPSGRNLQQWEFVVVTKRAEIEQIGQWYGKVVEQRFSKPWGPYEESFVHWSYTFGDAPLLVVALTEAVSDPAVQKMHIESAAAAFQNLLLAAYGEGLGTCWMTGPLRREKEIKELLAIGKEQEIVALTPVGYPAQWPEPPQRLDPKLETKVRWR